MPHLRALVERHKNDPFVLLGVNSGDSEEVYRAGLKKHEVSWTCAYQGDKNTITELFEVRGFPTYYLIGPDGKIVAKGHDGESMDAAIQKLIDGLKTSAE